MKRSRRLAIGVAAVAFALSACAHAPQAEKPAGIAPPTPATPPAEGYAQHLLERRCQSCHAMPDPRKHTRERWVRGIDTMRKRLQLTEADWDTLLALVPADSAAVPAPR